MELFFAQDPDPARTDADGLVVHEDPTDVLTWPCRLWRVTDPEGVIRLGPGLRWFRCRAFTVLAEVPAWQIFGDHGDRVAGVIEQARRLTVEQVSQLAALDPAGADVLYRAGWERWLARTTGRHLLGIGLSRVGRAVTAAARGVDDRLFAWDEEDEVDVLADADWVAARSAALCAAMAWGAPELFTVVERERLASRWAAVVGEIPRKSA